MADLSVFVEIIKNELAEEDHIYVSWTFEYEKISEENSSGKDVIFSSTNPIFSSIDTPYRNPYRHGRI